MTFTWDLSKSAETFRTRGFDFAFAARIFTGPTVEREDTRENYGERRIVALGQVDGRVLVVVYTDRARIRRIISARKANRREQAHYAQATR